MRTSRLLVLPLIIGAAAAPMIAPPAQAAATSASAARCLVTSYIGYQRVYSFYTKPVITHATQHGVGAHTSETVTESAAYQTKVTAGTKYSAGASGSVSWLWGSVGEHFNVTVAKSKSQTSTKTVTIKKYVANHSSHNRIYVAYRGVTTYTGHWYRTYCNGHGSTVGNIEKHWGSYITYAGGGDGFLYCKGGASSALGKAAIRGYCR